MTAFPADPIEAVTHPDPYPYYADLVARTSALSRRGPGALGCLERRGRDGRPDQRPLPGAAADGAGPRRTARHTGRDRLPAHGPLQRWRGPLPVQGSRLRRAGDDHRDPGRRAERRVGAIPFGRDRADTRSRSPVALRVSPADLRRGEPARHPRRSAPPAPRCGRAISRAASRRAAAPSRSRGARSRRAICWRCSATSSPTSGTNRPTIFWQSSRGRRGASGATRREIIVANGIGFLFQAYDATAGLIGNTLLALASHPDVHPGRRRSRPPAAVIDEVLRYDPPVQNTRRFLSRAGAIAGQEMHEGDAILVVLAAASRDPSANPHPDRFDISRVDRRLFTFGAGIHACPGASLATTIAQAGIAQLLASGADPARLANTGDLSPVAQCAHRTGTEVSSG